MRVHWVNFGKSDLHVIYNAMQINGMLGISILHIQDKLLTAYRIDLLMFKLPRFVKTKQFETVYLIFYFTSTCIPSLQV